MGSTEIHDFHERRRANCLAAAIAYCLDNRNAPKGG
jgi:hypothetical protein